MLNAFDIAAILHLKRNGKSYSGGCPSCGYKTGFTLTEDKGKTLYYCHAGGCSYLEIKQALIEKGLLSGSRYQTKPLINANPANLAKKPKYDSARASLELWKQSQSPQGTIAEVYLRVRGYNDPIPESIRFLPKHWHSEHKIHYPAMLCGVTRYPSPSIIAVHRTFLKPDGHGRIDKKCLGPTAGGAVYLAKVGSSLLITEGIETALTVLQAMKQPTWAALSTGGMKSLILPPLPLAKRITICADNDLPGMLAASVAAARFKAEGRQVYIAKPSQSGTDFNDLGRA